MMQKLTMAIIVGSVLTYSSIAAPPPAAADSMCEVDELDENEFSSYALPPLSADPDSEEEEHKVRIRRRLY